jgi:hypothetical protein
VNWRSSKEAGAQGAYLRSIDPALILLQDVNSSSIDTYARSAALDWITISPAPFDSDGSRGRSRHTAIGGRGISLVAAGAPMIDASLPERIHTALVGVKGQQFAVASYYAPPGVTWRYRKVVNALAFVGWLKSLRTPALFGADANTPLIDHPNYDMSRSHWHTGSRKLAGRPGDDCLWGPNLEHPLRDALRVWLGEHKTEMDRIKRVRAAGPLAISYWTRSQEPRFARRFDSIWITPTWSVKGIRYVEDASEYSDHRPVVADLVLSARRGRVSRLSGAADPGLAHGQSS